ncbi:50S ribosomal protein L21 [Breoghania sp.]|uniref:50S ribosomal protein L21 n=1 Tax=Breoghania sp. TaxID=2065378 RepID=UPI00262366F1|nr:50S ribosomal protein L21 [Breoghania sp.]MDJ0933310.1 50S ribosomal protein L21 [Breoghania sp.]
MFAVIKTGGKQYRVAADDLLKVEKVSGEAGDTVTFDTVLMVGGETETVIGTPTVEGASVAAEVVEQVRNRKVVIFKKRRRQNYRRTKGHRREVTLVRISDILTGGAKPKAKKLVKTEAAAAAEVAGGADDLKKLTGLGPAIEKKLNAAGVTTYAQIASMTADDVARVEEEAGLKGRFERDNWVEQAKELAGK